ncbi:beta-1,3-galactosyltransferase 6-like [Xenia sp. Carnegie-2017]|uniref:beta-1,3-galactosyltransferase 6-like n=1 Tax=Xenia sp. Carnegie-2017 TaxID=2897299 RepID=UPI001F0459BA|nr:beta-1,3-galactosyltransferase 6-like [Xenia sp. Carnegie-2017]
MTITRFLSHIGIRHPSKKIISYLVAVTFMFYIGLYPLMSTITEKRRSLSIVNAAEENHKIFFKRKKVTAFLFVLVLTGPKNFDRRNAMRSTWLNLTELPSIGRKFVIGTADLSSDAEIKLNEEQSQHNDLVYLPNLKDDYSKLTLKLLYALTWMNENIEYSFLLKVDDDTFARLDIILQELNTKYFGLHNLYWGFHRGDARVKYAGRWAELKWKLCDRYLPYALGGGYILSMKLVQFIANTSSMLELYNSEDVSLGAWLSPLKLTRVHDVRFDTEWKTRGCRNVHIISHKQSIQDMHQKFAQLKNNGKLCITETSIRPSYIYSWNGPPSQCCVRRYGIP